MSTEQSPLTKIISPPEPPRPLAGEGLGARLPRLLQTWRARLPRQAPPSGGPGREALSAGELEKAGAALLALQRGLTGDRLLAGSTYMQDPALLGAYLLYYWPVSYMQVSLALAERPFAARRVLDLGSGPGPASAAVIDACASGPPSGGVEELVLVDSSRAALDVAASTLGAGAAGAAAIRTVELDLESESAALPDGPFDLIVAAHCLNELWKGEAGALRRRQALVARAAERLSPGGLILLVEPALLATCRDLIALRDALAADSWSVLGPCPGSFGCPAFAAGPQRSCHAQSPWQAPAAVAALAKAAGLERDSVKFAYFFLRPGPERPEGNPRLRRVISDPMLNKAGRLRYVLCGDGRLETISARSDDPSARAKGFMDLRRGDTLAAEGLEARGGGGLGLVPSSELELLARAPEASP